MPAHVDLAKCTFDMFVFVTKNCNELLSWKCLSEAICFHSQNFFTKNSSR